MSKNPRGLVALSIEAPSLHEALRRHLKHEGYDVADARECADERPFAWLSDWQCVVSIGKVRKQLRQIHGTVPLVALLPERFAMQALTSNLADDVLVLPTRWAQLSLLLERLKRQGEQQEADRARLSALHRRLGYQSLCIYPDGSAIDPLDASGARQHVAEVFDFETFSSDDALAPVSLRARETGVGLEGCLVRMTAPSQPEWLVFRPSPTPFSPPRALEVVAEGLAYETSDALAYLVSDLNFVVDALRGADVDSELREAVEEARTGAERVSHVLTDLRKYLGQDPERSRTLDVHEVLGFALRMATPAWSHLAAIVVHPGQTPLVHTSPAKLTHVLLKLLIIAGRMVTASHGARRVELSTQVSSDDTLEVGLTLVFDEHASLELTETSRAGLVMASALATELGGGLRVTRNAGRHEFTLAVPAVGTANEHDDTRVLWVGKQFESTEARRGVLRDTDSGVWCPSLDATTPPPQCDLVLVDDDAGETLRPAAHFTPFSPAGNRFVAGRWYVRAGASAGALSRLARHARPTAVHYAERKVG